MKINGLGQKYTVQTEIDILGDSLKYDLFTKDCYFMYLTLVQSEKTVYFKLKGYLCALRDNVFCQCLMLRITKTTENSVSIQFF